MDGIKNHFVPFTEDEEKKTLFINNKTITVYRSDSKELFHKTQYLLLNSSSRFHF